jgi:hypothetical protein
LRGSIELFNAFAAFAAVVVAELTTFAAAFTAVVVAEFTALRPAFTAKFADFARFVAIEFT